MKKGDTIIAKDNGTTIKGQIIVLKRMAIVVSVDHPLSCRASACSDLEEYASMENGEHIGTVMGEEVALRLLKGLYQDADYLASHPEKMTAFLREYETERDAKILMLKSLTMKDYQDYIQIEKELEMLFPTMFTKHFPQLSIIDINEQLFYRYALSI